MKKKEAIVKLQLSRETLRALEQENLVAVQGGSAVSQLYSCIPCNTLPTDRC